MDGIFFACLVAPKAALFFGIGIYAWKRKKPMWFWSGTTVSEEEISDVPAYNRANGIMWIAFSCVFWISAVCGLMQIKTGGIILIAGCLLGIPALIFVYGRIYNKYKNQK